MREIGIVLIVLGALGAAAAGNAIRQLQSEDVIDFLISAIGTASIPAVLLLVGVALCVSKPKPPTQNQGKPG